jgi:hypothetical protein
MKIVLSGGEKGTYRKTLLENEAPHIALNITQFPVPKRKEVNLKELLQGAELVVYSSDEDEDVAKYDEFIRTHVDDISLVIGRPDYNGEWLGEKYVPLWNDDKDEERLAFLCQKYGRVAISDRAINSRTLTRIRQLQQRWGCLLVGITSKVDVIESANWDVVIVSSWTSVVRYGETQVWDGHGLRRYPAQKKESSRKKHRADIVRLGVDFDAVLEDDVNEVAKLAVRSWKAWEEATFGTPTSSAYHPSEALEEHLLDDDETEQVATIGTPVVSHQSRSNDPYDIANTAPTKRGESGRVLLPVMGVETVVSLGTESGEEGEEHLEIDPHREDVVTFRDYGVRQCDSCYLASRCPEFQAHAECAFKMPVELKTKEQLRAVLRAMLEMQTSRIMFAAFAEQLEGQGMDPALSKEMDRLFEMTERFKNIEDTRDLVRFEVEAKAGAGVLSRIFGDRAANKLNEVSTPLNAKQLDQVIIDAEVLGEVE